MRTQIVAALEESLAAMPDPADILVEVHDGIERRHRRNRYYRTGFAITAIALILIVSLAAASVLSDHDRRPAVIPVGEWKISVRPTWLPDGMIAQEFGTTAGQESISYHSADSIMSIVVHADRDQPSHPGGSPVDIDGQPGWELSGSTSTTLVFQLPSGRWAMIDLIRTDPNLPDARPKVRDDALHVARSLREDGDMRLRTRFAPTYLPTAQRIVGLATNIFTPAGFGTIWCTVGSTRVPAAKWFPTTFGFIAPPNWPGAGPGVRISMTTVAVNKDLDATVRIADIQGRPAYRSIAATAVVVAGVNGGTLEVAATLDGKFIRFAKDPPAGLVPLAELIKVAEGVRWVG